MVPDGYKTYWGESLHKVYESVQCTPESNRILHVIKNKSLKVKNNNKKIQCSRKTNVCINYTQIHLNYTKSNEVDHFHQVISKTISSQNT